jgi:hypothetical protein
MPLRGSLHDRAPQPLVRYAHGLALSIVHNVPAYWISMVITTAAITATAELHHPTPFHALLFLLGATGAFAVVGFVASVAFEEERIEEASPQTVFIGSILSVASVSAGFGAGFLVCHFLSGSFAWFLTAFGATTAYVLVLALEMELANYLREAGGN